MSSTLLLSCIKSLSVNRNIPQACNLKPITIISSSNSNFNSTQSWRIRRIRKLLPVSRFIGGVYLFCLFVTRIRNCCGFEDCRSVLSDLAWHGSAARPTGVRFSRVRLLRLPAADMQKNKKHLYFMVTKPQNELAKARKMPGKLCQSYFFNFWSNFWFGRELTRLPHQPKLQVYSFLHLSMYSGQSVHWIPCPWTTR